MNLLQAFQGEAGGILEGSLKVAYDVGKTHFLSTNLVAVRTHIHVLANSLCERLVICGSYKERHPIELPF